MWEKLDNAGQEKDGNRREERREEDFEADRRSEVSRGGMKCRRCACREVAGIVPFPRQQYLSRCESLLGHYG